MALALLAVMPAAEGASAAGWRNCEGSFEVSAGGKQWKLAKFRTSGVSCRKAKSVGRKCTIGSCPDGWKQKIERVDAKPPVWWHTAWTYAVAPAPLVQWRRVRAN